MIERLWTPRGMPIGAVGNGTGGAAGPTYQALVLGDGPNGYWRLGEAVGLVAADATGTQNGAYSAAGVTYGQAGLINANPGTSVRFDGVNGEVSIPNHARYTLATTGALSIETWILSAAEGGVRRLVRKSDAAELAMEWSLSRNGVGNIIAQVWDAVGNPVATAQSPLGYLAASGKHHVVMTMLNTVDIILYVDGAAVANDNTWVGAAVGNLPSPVTISAASGGSQYNGQEQEVAIYPSVLSPADILAHFALGF